jgi:hypothetical protein
MTVDLRSGSDAVHFEQRPARFAQVDEHHAGNSLRIGGALLEFARIFLTMQARAGSLRADMLPATWLNTSSTGMNEMVAAVSERRFHLRAWGKRKKPCPVVLANAG